VNALKEFWNQGAADDFEANEEHNVSSLLKMFLRELPGPLIPFALYDELIKHQKDVDQGIAARSDANVKTMLKFGLPSANHAVLKVVVRLMKKVSDFAEFNKMDATNLAVGNATLRACVAVNCVAIRATVCGLAERCSD
jgi:hypothetical protein